jgi:ASC-1-like (ASCH) protein
MSTFPESPRIHIASSINDREQESLPETPKKKRTIILSPLLRNQQNNSTRNANCRSSEAISRHQSLALKLKANRLLPRFCATLPLKMNYLKMILDGRKTVEGRVNTGLPARTRVNDTILFFSGDVCCLTQVVEKQQFPTFREMLDHYGITTCLPDFTGDLSAAERLYRSFPGYAQKEKDFGVLGLKLRVMDQEEMENMNRRTIIPTASSSVSMDRNGRDSNRVGPPTDRVRDNANHNESHCHDSRQLASPENERGHAADDAKLSGKRRGRDDDDYGRFQDHGDSRGGSRKRRESGDDKYDSEKRRR